MGRVIAVDILDALDLLYEHATEAGRLRAWEHAELSAGDCVDAARTDLANAVAALLAHGYVAGPDPEGIDHHSTQPL